MRTILGATLMLLSCSLAQASQTTPTSPQSWYSFIWENDFIADDDSGYTNGLAIGWGHQIQTKPWPAFQNKLFELLPYFVGAHRNYSVSYRLAQAMFTPDDIEASQLIEDDRPYAGLLLASAHAQSHDQSHDLQQSWSYSAGLGVVGPASGAEQVQKWIHQLIGVNTPNGWDHQLDNELTFMLSVEHLRRLRHSQHHNLETDWILLSSADLGTLHSEAGIGLGFRLGRSLAASFPSANLIPGRRLNPDNGSVDNHWNVFFNLYARYVFNDLPIEGNTFSNSHGVSLTHAQALMSVGWIYVGKEWGTTISIQESTRTFEEKRENTLFANFAFSFNL